MRITLYLLASTLLSLFLFMPLPASGAIKTNVIYIGQHVRIPAIPNSRLYVKNKKIISIKDKRDQLIITGKAIGVARLRMSGHTYYIQVMRHDSFVEWSQLKNTLKRYMGLQLQNHSMPAKVTGRLHRWKDWLAISKIFNSCESAQYKFVAQIDKDIQNTIKRYFQSLIKKQSHLSGYVDFKNNILKVSTHPKNVIEIDKILCPFGIQVTATDQIIENPINIKVTLWFVETEEKIFSSFGLNHKGSVGFQLLPNWINQSVLSAYLESQKNKGKTQIWARPVLISQNAQKSEFFVGGEIPIKKQNFHGQSIVWKPYGLKIQSTPRWSLGNKIHLVIDTHLSSVDISYMTDSAPSLKSTKFKTKIILKNRQGAMISQLQKITLGKSKNSFLNIPFLKDLFGKGAVLSNKTKIFIFAFAEVMK